VVNAARLDLGVSYVQGRPALAVVLERLPATLLLTGSALVVSTLVGIALGIFTASHPDRWPAAAIDLALLGLLATPGFWLAQLALVAIALHAGWLPVGGMTDPRSSSTGLGAIADVARHLVLPMSVLAAGEVAVISRLSRVGLLHELGQDYVRTARAKGLREVRILTRHALRPAMLPVLTVIGGRVGHLLSGAVLVEMVFGWPGIGRLLLSSVQARDIPVVLSTLLVVGLSVVLANLLTDLAYVRLDPRIRYR
jgi:peptide/nickel transport system permease protein